MVLGVAGVAEVMVVGVDSLRVVVKVVIGVVKV